MQQPIVSVCVITYNHQAFINQCLDGIIEQQTNFDYDIVIGEDCSTDTTASIIKEYARVHKHINFLDNSKNLGAIPNFIRTLKACKGKYIAFCEGDDYWIDRNKLQKQVDFLEQHPKYGGVCGEIISRDVDNQIEESHPLKQEGIITFEEIIVKNKIHSNTILFRSNLLNVEDLNAIMEISVGDWYLHLLVTKKKPYYYLPDYFALYRIHDLGIFSKKSDFYKSYQKVRLLNIFLKNECDSQNSYLVKESLQYQVFQALKESTKEDKKELKELFSILLNHKILKMNRSVIGGAINLIK
ncbi:glycosyltransferase [Sediminibacter sp. Hel_I_10]|uniref:glycosyltransferase n=1 Tax=Sediminibacter sp. Hel_I_10 TaxID=1392490 RepID=UPI00068E5119|nr:glycosyltransferase [Sediminibacter sp. Hel_I_10]